MYRDEARASYPPPGPSWDPWGPYVSEASERFDVPATWIRAVMHQESSERPTSVSDKGAMGLMQLMPFTYDLMRDQYNLGDDPYDPHNSILAGTAYIRQMYDIYGTPGFLAAYDAGPGRLDDYLIRNRPLPAETRNYVASIGPKLSFESPHNRSEADMIETNRMASNASSDQGNHEGLQQNSGSLALSASVHDSWTHRDFPGRSRPAVTYASASPLRPMNAHTSSTFSRSSASNRSLNAHLVSPPNDELAGSVAEAPDIEISPRGHAKSTSRVELQPGAWAIQVGAFGTMSAAEQAAGAARVHGGALLRGASPEVEGVRMQRGKLFRARLTGLSKHTAEEACGHARRGDCTVITPAGST